MATCKILRLNSAISILSTSKYVEDTHITQATRFSPNDNEIPSLIDHIWYNALHICNSGIISYNATDHCPTYLQLPCNTSDSKNNELIKINFRINNDETSEKFSQ